MKFIIIDKTEDVVVANTDIEEDLISEIENIIIDYDLEDLAIYKRYAVIESLSIKKTEN